MGKITRYATFLILAVVFVALVVINASSKPSNAEKIWDERTTIGNLDAKNYYVMYTDLACPYCDAFSRSIMENQEQFEQYIAENDIVFEMRVTEFLYEFGEHKVDMSRWSAEGTYCATQQDKFWDYYHAALSSLWSDYHSKGIGVSKTSPMIANMTSDYWVKVGEKAGMDATELKDCMGSTETLEAIQLNTKKAARIVQGGLPYFVFNKFTTGGFDNNWGWDYVERYLDAGLSKKS